MSELATAFLDAGLETNCGRPVRGEVERRIRHQEGLQQKRAVILLFTGAACGFFGFAFAGFLGVWEFCCGEAQLNYRGEPMASGRNYYAQTVSEMVGDPASPAGKSFFSLCLVAAICMLVSFYPYHLQNVFVGDNECIMGISWLALRTALPPIGLMLTVLAPAKPPEQSSFQDLIALGIHCVGAAMMLSGHMVFELHAIFFSKVVRMSTCERIVRGACVGGCMLSGTAFVWIHGIHMKLASGRHPICCEDVWRVPTMEDIEHAKILGHPGIMERAMAAYDKGERMLLDTASGAILALKIAEYWMEVATGLFMIAGLLAIWGFSKERAVDLDEELPALCAEEMRTGRG